MKQYSHIIRYTLVFVLFLNSQFFILNSLRAQGFEWVRTYTGSDISSGDATNKIIGSCVDSAGNLYIFGQFSPYAQLCGERLLPSEVIEPSSPRWQGIVIAKLSPAGELLWHKAIYNGKRGCYAHALRMVGDSCIMAMVRFYLPFDGGYNVSMKLYYLDTLLTGNDDYLMPSDSVIITEDFTAFITFDLDGNEVERHLVGVGYTDTIGNALTHRFRMGGGTAYSDKLSVDALSHESFNIDNEGNIYVLRNTQDEVSGASYHYWRVADGTIGSMKIVVDGTHFLTYPIPYPTAVWNQQILKFSPHFDSLIGAVYMFDSTLSYPMSMWPELNSFSIDAQNNLYICMMGSQVPAHLRIINSNSLHLGDSLSGSSWIIKYNSDLYGTDLIQFSADRSNGTDDSPLLGVSDCYVDETTNSIFVSGTVFWSLFTVAPIILYNDDTIDLPNNSGYWMRLDKDDHSILSLERVLPGEDGKVTVFPKLTTSNNRVFSEVGFLWSMIIDDSTMYANHYSDYDKAFSIWDYHGNGLYFNKHGLSSMLNNIRAPIIIDSIVYLTGTLWEDATFGDTTIYHQGYSQAFIAKYVDPEFARPYMHPSDREEQAIEWPQTLAFTLADSPVTLTATATSGLPVSYSCSDSSIAFPEGDQLHLLREGTATVTAMQPGDYYHLPAEPVTKTLQVGHVGIEASENHAPLLYPNPATNAVRIIPGGERVTAVRLVSALGQPLPAPLSSGRIDLSALPAGIYYLSIITETTSYQHKIVKQ